MFIVMWSGVVEKRKREGEGGREREIEIERATVLVEKRVDKHVREEG